MDIKPILDELSARMAEELDYRLEAAVAGDRSPRPSPTTRDFAVPDVVARQRARHRVASGSRARRSPRIIADGHPGASATPPRSSTCEFLLAGPAARRPAARRPAPGQLPAASPDGRLGVIDFGAVNRLPDGLPPEMGRCSPIGAGRRRRGRARRACARWASSSRPSTIDAEALLDYLEPSWRRCRTDSSPSAGPGCAGCSPTSTTRGGPTSPSGCKLNLPPEYLLIHRVWLGGIGVLCQLGGTVPAAPSSSTCDAARQLPQPVV